MAYLFTNAKKCINILLYQGKICAFLHPSVYETENVVVKYLNSHHWIHF